MAGLEETQTRSEPFIKALLSGLFLGALCTWVPTIVDGWPPVGSGPVVGSLVGFILIAGLAGASVALAPHRRSLGLLCWGIFLAVASWWAALVIYVASIDGLS